MSSLFFKLRSSTIFQFVILAMTVFGVMNAKADPHPSRPIAMVYFGPGVCPGCPDDLAAALARAGFQIQKAFPGTITHANLSRAKIFAVPGGDEERDVMNALRPGEASAIKSFVQAGGHYLGVCLGAYLAVPKLIDTLAQPQAGLDLYDGTVQNHSATKEARMEFVQWQDEQRWMYFQDGPEFHLNHPELVDIWAHYDDGSIAAFQSPLGAGKVGLIGPHPEATQEWLDEDGIAVPHHEAFRPSDDLFKKFLNRLVN